MSLAALKEPYLLLIMEDDEPTNPREDYDNFGHMMCWHSRYNLGDKHDFESSSELLGRLALESVDADTAINYVKSGKANTVRLEYDNFKQGWKIDILDSFPNKWYNEKLYIGTLDERKEDILEGLMELLPDKNIFELASEKNIILPLNLYDHSGISMSVSSFLGRAQHAEWDSGQVGWIYATPEDIQKEYGSLSPESYEKAKALLQGEVKTYNYYLNNQCYGFRLYENGEEADSCWGFLGELSDVEKEIASNLPESHRDIIDHMQEVTDTCTRSKDYEDYMEELEEMEA
ncbi:MAG: hypothetical protein RR865_10435 [Clostridia bacterium]